MEDIVSPLAATLASQNRFSSLSGKVLRPNSAILKKTKFIKISISWKLLKNLQLLIFFLPHILQVAEA